MFTFGAKKVEARAGYASGSLTTAGSRSSSGSASSSSLSASSSSGSRGGIVLPMMVTMLQSTNHRWKRSQGCVRSCRLLLNVVTFTRTLARELGVGKASALLPVTMPTHRAQNLHKWKGRPQSHSPSLWATSRLRIEILSGRAPRVGVQDVALNHYAYEKTRPRYNADGGASRRSLSRRCRCFRQQYSVLAEDGHGDRLRGVANEFVGNNGGVSFSVLQRRELFTDIVVDTDASVVGPEEITRHERSPFLSKNEIRLGGCKLTLGFKGTDKILRSHSAEILSPLCGRSSPALFAGKNWPANADSRRLAWTPP